MRQGEYRFEKKTYKDRKYIDKNDRKYKQKYPEKYRFHLFVRLKIISIKDDVATVIYSGNKTDIQMINMDAFFYFNEDRKTKMLALLSLFRIS